MHNDGDAQITKQKTRRKLSKSNTLKAAKDNRFNANNDTCITPKVEST